MTTAIATASDAGVFTTGTERILGTGADGLRGAWSAYRAYRTSIAELSALTDRQLADVGVARAAIRTLVRTAVYGN